jgi:hypothetical protein
MPCRARLRVAITAEEGQATVQIAALKPAISVVSLRTTYQPLRPVFLALPRRPTALEQGIEHRPDDDVSRRGDNAGSQAPCPSGRSRIQPFRSLRRIALINQTANSQLTENLSIVSAVRLCGPRLWRRTAPDKSEQLPHRHPTETFGNSPPQVAVSQILDSYQVTDSSP